VFVSAAWYSLCVAHHRLLHAQAPLLAHPYILTHVLQVWGKHI
jgi:hypothetical protein